MPILGNRLLRRQSVAYLLRDEFTTAQSAPLTTPRTCEPGPGTLTIVDVETDKLSINSSGQLVFAAQSSGVWGEEAVYSATLTRVAGRAFFYSVRFTNNLSSFGFVVGIGTGAGGSYANLAAGYAGIYVGNTLLAVMLPSGSSVAVGAVLVSGTTYQMVVVELASGYQMFIKGGIFTNFTLLFETYVGNVAGGALLSNYDDSGTVDYIRVRDITPFVATLNIASPVNGNLYAGDADAEITMTLASAGTILTSGGFRFRVVDANNYWVVYFNTSGAFRVDIVTAGVAANQFSVAAVTGTSTTRTIRVDCSGNKLMFFSLNGSQATGTAWTQRGSTLTDSTFISATGVQPDFGADWTVTNLVERPKTSAAYTAALEAG